MRFLTQERELSFEKKTQVLYFYSCWTIFHQKMLLMLDGAEQYRSNMAFFAIDVDYFKGLCRRFNVYSVPMVIIMQSGKEIRRITGSASATLFTPIFDDICALEA